MEFEVYEASCISSYLSDLATSSGTLAPVFSSLICDYTASVGYDTGIITVTPTAVDPQATIKVNGCCVIGGQASMPICLNVGDNQITIEVFSEIGEVNTYHINVVRLGSPYLSNLAISSGTLAPVFDRNTFCYTATVEYDIQSVIVTPTAVDPQADITVNGYAVSSGQPSAPIALNVGENLINIQVIPKIGDSYTYHINVVRSSSAYLCGLTVKYGRTFLWIEPAFAKDVYCYQAYTTYLTSSVTFTAIAEDLNSYMTINGTPIISGAPWSFGVHYGVNLFVIHVTSHTGIDSRTYYLNIMVPTYIPNILSAVPSSDSITVTWSSVLGATGYDIEVDGVVIDNGAGTTFAHHELSPNTQHTYRVRAKNSYTVSSWSTLLTKTTLLEAPENVSALASDTNVILTWDAVADATGYDIEADGVIIDNGTSLTYEHSDLQPNTQHIYRVRAKNANGAGEWSPELSVSTTNPVCTVTCLTDGIINLILKASDIKDFSQLTFSVSYDANCLEAVDLCLLTSQKELSAGNIAGTDITITEYTPGNIKFTVDKTLEEGKSWSGNVNCIMFKSIVDNTQTSITYTVE